MFHVVAKVEILKEIVEVVRTIIDEVKITFQPEELTIRAVDPGHISMIDLTVTSGAFETYEVEDHVELGVNIEKLRSFLKLAASGTDIQLKISESTHELIISFGHIERKMLLIDIDNLTEPKMPDLNLPGIVTIEAKELKQVIDISQDISDHIRLVLEPDKFIVENTGDTGSAKLELPKDNVEELVCKEHIKSSFALDYFSKMIRSVAKSDFITLEMANDHPIKMKFTMAEQNGLALYLLAPRIES